jgi:ATP-binding cassette subfamily C protein
MDLTMGFRKVADHLLLFSDLWPLVVIMAVFGAALWLGPGAIGTGDFLAFNTALVQGLVAAVGLARGVLPLLDGLEQYERFRPILQAGSEVGAQPGGALALEGAIRLTDVSFQYGEDGPPVLDGVSLQVRPGEFVAVVGPSGSGKSTLLRLLLGFETPTAGVVAYDGRELATLNVQDVRRQVGVVLQNADLQPGDIYSNIVGWTPSSTAEDAWEALELAGLADDVEQMPMGLHTIVTDGGGGLSTGQRQRLLIAGALARRPRILFFDEATSALDNRTQAHVSRSVHENLRGTTRLVIAHRLSTIVDADRIYVLSAGKIVQSGSYAQLMRETGPFRELARRQTLEGAP